jgi:DNA-binding NtrC family response regulator
VSYAGSEGSLVACGLWRRKDGKSFSHTRRVLVAHSSADIGDSITLLLGLKGFPSRLATNETSFHFVFDRWHPQVVFADTRISGGNHHAMLERVVHRVHNMPILLIALSDAPNLEPIALLKSAGYDGYLQRPCPIWQMADFLNNFYVGGADPLSG